MDRRSTSIPTETDRKIWSQPSDGVTRSRSPAATAHSSALNEWQSARLVISRYASSSQPPVPARLHFIPSIEPVQTPPAKPTLVAKQLARLHIRHSLSAISTLTALL
ncbi:hypothetical protein PaG_03878 [Moesziomyces aphidis]|uniref:Uncharacterized protein n=1 Tax=Moesziomyces aphidis TaxID=84754 RepID=W3VM14_MOEAP|nr:hypothetical protein PaG_03878 [Moesziomyces aphidis]